MPDLIPSAFAIEGDKTIPPATDPNGFVNFLQGYTDFYELNLASGNPDAKAVERGVQNYLFGLTTDNIAWLQRNGLPMWYPNMPNGYPKNAIVQRVATDGTIKPYRSLVAANMSDPLTTPASWEYEPTAAETLLNVPMPSGGASGPTGLIISAALDFNSLVTGTYDILSDAVAAACSNAPSVLGGSILAGMLECMAWQNAGIAMIVQRYTDRSGSSFARGAVGGAWTSWNQIIDVAHGDVRYAKLNGATSQRFSVSDATAPTDAASARQVVSGSLGTATAGGSATAMTAAFPASPASYAIGQRFVIVSSVSNTGAMTAVVTLGGVAQASVPVVKGNNQPLSPGDFPAGYPGEFLYNGALVALVMVNPATAAATPSTSVIQPVTASVSGNALTLTLNPTKIDFRSPVAASGDVNTRTVAAPISLVIPSGATLGTTAGNKFTLILIAIDNGGTVELAVSVLNPTVTYDESKFVTTNAVSTGSNSQSAVYSAIARSNVPFRVVGAIEITEATAGTWATGPSLIKGSGGGVMPNLNGFGYGQRNLQMYGTSRFFNTGYQNLTGRPIFVSVGAYTASSGQIILYSSYAGSGAPAVIAIAGSQVANGQGFTVSGIIAPGEFYSVNSQADVSPVSWCEFTIT